MIVASLKPHQHHPHCAWTSTTDQGQIVCHSSHVPPSRRSRRVLQCLFHHYTDYLPWAATYSAHCSTVHFPGSRKCPFQSLDLQKLQVSAFLYVFVMVLHQLQKIIVNDDDQWWTRPNLPLSINLISYKTNFHLQQWHFCDYILLPSPTSFIIWFRHLLRGTGGSDSNGILNTTQSSKENLFLYM